MYMRVYRNLLCESREYFISEKKEREKKNYVSENIRLDEVNREWHASFHAIGHNRFLEAGVSDFRARIRPRFIYANGVVKYVDTYSYPASIVRYDSRFWLARIFECIYLQRGKHKVA